jgi:hypothetical protein
MRASSSLDKDMDTFPTSGNSTPAPTLHTPPPLVPSTTHHHINLSASMIDYPNNRSNEDSFANVPVKKTPEKTPEEKKGGGWGILSIFGGSKSSGGADLGTGNSLVYNKEYKMWLKPVSLFSIIRVVSKCILFCLCGSAIKQTCVFYAAKPHVQRQLRHSRNKKNEETICFVLSDTTPFCTVSCEISIISIFDIWYTLFRFCE